MRRHARLRVPLRRGLGGAPRLERRQAALGRAPAARARGARRRANCSRRARSGSRPGDAYTLAVDGRRLVATPASTACPPGCTPGSGPLDGPRRPRPVVLNTWEAVYFDQDLATLDPLVDAAAEAGVERFVLDDGWFTGRTRRPARARRLDRRSRALARRAAPADRRACTSGGMEFGLWVEPEMVSPDSDARPRASRLGARPARRPDLAAPARARPRRARTRTTHVLDRLDALLDEYPIAYLKWDHNRDLLGRHRPTGRPAPLYRAARRAARARFPRVEIEICASGGARIDLGILERVDRVWTSDTNDPLERQRIQRWTGRPAAARVPRRARRRAARAHHRPHQRPQLPAGDRAVRQRRHRVGPRPRRPTPSCERSPAWVAAVQAAAAAAARRHGRAQPTATTPIGCCTASSPPTACTRSFSVAMLAPRGRPCPAGGSVPGPRPDRRYTVRPLSSARRRGPCRTPRRPGSRPERSTLHRAGAGRGRAGRAAARTRERNAIRAHSGVRRGPRRSDRECPYAERKPSELTVSAARGRTSLARR